MPVRPKGAQMPREQTMRMDMPPGPGRPFGSRNRRTKEIIEQIIKNGFKDPLIVLSELQIPMMNLFVPQPRIC